MKKFSILSSIFIATAIFLIVIMFLLILRKLKPKLMLIVFAKSKKSKLCPQVVKII